MYVLLNFMNDCFLYVFIIYFFIIFIYNKVFSRLLRLFRDQAFKKKLIINRKLKKKNWFFFEACRTLGHALFDYSEEPIALIGVRSLMKKRWDPISSHGLESFTTSKHPMITFQSTDLFDSYFTVLKILRYLIITM